MNKSISSCVYPLLKATDSITQIISALPTESARANATEKKLPPQPSVISTNPLKVENQSVDDSSY